MRKKDKYQKLRRRAAREKALAEILIVEEPVPVEPDPIYIISMKDPRDGTGLMVECSCMNFFRGPDTNLLWLGQEAFKHAEETGHVLRPHA